MLHPVYQPATPAAEQYEEYRSSEDAWTSYWAEQADDNDWRTSH